MAKPPRFRTSPIGAGTQEGTGRSSGAGVSGIGAGHSGPVTGAWGVQATAVDVENAIAAIGVLEERVKIAAQAAANAEAHREFKITQHRVPIYEGQLQKSGRVEEEVDESGDTITVGIAYGGPAGVGLNTKDVPYALIVHEDLEAHHLFGRTAKYVENVVREEIANGRASAYMGEIMREILGI